MGITKPRNLLNQEIFGDATLRLIVTTLAKVTIFLVSRRYYVKSATARSRWCGAVPPHPSHPYLDGWCFDVPAFERQRDRASCRSDAGKTKAGSLQWRMWQAGLVTGRRAVRRRR